MKHGENRTRGVAPADAGRRTTPAGPEAPAVARAAKLLDLLAGSRDPLPLAELVRRLGLPKSTVHGLCATLVQTGLVTRFENGSYHLGVRIMDLAHGFLGRADLTGEFARLVDTDRPFPEESLVLSVLDGADVVYVACRHGSRPFGYNFRIGMRLPAHCTATGKAMLASVSRQRIAALHAQRAFYALTVRSITEPARLERELSEVRRRGYAIDDEETREGMVCIAAPVRGPDGGEALAAVGISLPKASLDKARREAVLGAVVTLAEALSRRVGARAA